MTKIETAQITHTSLGYEDHGIFTFYLTLEGDGWGVGFGGRVLDTYNKTLKRRVGTAYGLEQIGAILRTVGVSNWEQLKGQYVRCKTDGLGSKVSRLGHIIKDVWVDLDDGTDLEL